MKIGKYNLTLKNIGSYIQGNYRMLLEKFGGEFITLPKHIQEQIVYRAKLANKECIESGICKCNCPVPDVFYADKACEEGCYPEMLNKKKWDLFKEGKVDDIILDDYSNYNKVEFIPSELHISDLGDIKVNNQVERPFKTNLPLDAKLEINQVSVSCPCVQFELGPYPKSPDSNGEYHILEDVTGMIKVDTKNKPIGKSVVWITIRYNKINRINLQVKFNVI